MLPCLLAKDRSDLVFVYRMRELDIALPRDQCDEGVYDVQSIDNRCKYFAGPQVGYQIHLTQVFRWHRSQGIFSSLRSKTCVESLQFAQYGYCLLKI